MTEQEKKELEHELQELVIRHDSLYARCLIGVSTGSVHLTELGFNEMAVPNSIVSAGEAHYKGKTKNGLCITTIRD